MPGQPASPDHRDGGGPHDYSGWAHQGCNVSAGASRGNALRAAAYRREKGLPAANSNGSGPVEVEIAEGTVRDREGGGAERWSKLYGWVPMSRRW